ncbi:MAG: limonene-1,2-epoxide hydrolase family protein [Novosphingobium sp.]
MPTPTEVVLDFLKALEKPGGFPDAIRAFFTAETRYLNVGMSDTTGIPDTVAFVEGFMGSTTASYMTVDMLALAETGNKVLTERIDHLHNAEGQAVMSLAVMGIFEVESGKISGWRDYFDTAGTMGAAG